MVLVDLIITHHPSSLTGVSGMAVSAYFNGQYWLAISGSRIKIVATLALHCHDLISRWITLIHHRYYLSPIHQLETNVISIRHYCLIYTY